MERPVFHWNGDMALIKLGDRRIVIRPDLRVAAQKRVGPVERQRWFVCERSTCIGSIERHEGPDRDAAIWARIADWLKG